MMFCSTLIVLSFWTVWTAPVVHSWVQPNVRHDHRFGIAQENQFHSRLQSAAASEETPDLTGKTLYQRVFYRWNPISDVAIPNAVVIEERVRFEADPERAGYIMPIGPRTLILRDGQVEEGEIGDDFFTIDVHDDTKSHNGADSSLQIESAIATAAYLASNPDLCTGKVIEVDCDLGLASLLGCIGAGYVSRKMAGDDPVKADVADEILTVPKTTEDDELLPKNLKALCLTDGDEKFLNLAFYNAKNSGVSPAKVTTEETDWTQPRSQPLVHGAPPLSEFRTIVASDVDFAFPEAKELARNVANHLEPSAPYIFADPGPVPRFVHVCPDEREDTVYLRRFLEKGYRMATTQGYLKLEKLIFVYQTLPSLEPESKLDDLELELQEFKESVYQSLTAQHHPDYAGWGTGELFFPMETGEIDEMGGSTYLEREWDAR